MRKDYSFNACIPNTRNDLIDAIGEEKPVIVIKNALISECAKELNQEKKDANKTGRTLKTAGILAGLWALFCSTHPVGWIIGGVTAITAGTIKKIRKTMNHYETYLGKDSFNRDIYVMIHDRVDLKLDTIEYSELVKSVNTKRKIKKIKL